MNSQKAAVFWRIFLLVGSRQVLLSLWRAQFFSSNQKVPLLKFSVCNVLTIFSACLFPPKNSSYEFSVSLVLTIFFFSSGFMLAVMCAAIGSNFSRQIKKCRANFLWILWFDDFFAFCSRFYVGCDVCSNWFHGSCVGITETMAKNMTEYICDECRNARENREIYSICQQPYDEPQ